MKIDVLLGLQWGDEGKGKIVDVLTPHYDVIARFQGGPNAGHTLEFDQIKHVLHTIPSGIFHVKKLNIIGNGVVIDPIIFKQEIEELLTYRLEPRHNLKISKKAHLILPTHKLLDAAYEADKKDRKIGSTLKGIGPTYTDKTARLGLRVGDVLKTDFKARYQAAKAKHLKILDAYQFEYQNCLPEIENAWLDSIEFLKTFELIDCEYEMAALLQNRQAVLAEGAQGTLLDIDFGSYPFVTSSNTVTAGACTGLGVAPAKIGKVIGIAKAYCTRVGSGPFPTEQTNAIGELLRKHGGEFGATTGRPRRCGWLDLVALKYAVMINGVTEIILTKSDVLSACDTLKVCVEYRIDGVATDRFPYDTEVEPECLYKEFPIWNQDLTGIRNYADLPQELRIYIEFIENYLQIPISIVSVGPDREQIIFKS